MDGTVPPSLHSGSCAEAARKASPFVDTERRQTLENELLTLWGHINAATYRFLELLAEFDRTEGWGGVGITSCAHWLNVFCGIGTVAAREKVRVARALEDLPQIRESFGRGEISYSKVRAMTRIATPAIEENLLMVARHGTASHIAKLVHHFRAVERREEARQAEAIQRERYVRTWHDDDGTLVLQARLPAEVGAIIERAIEAAMALELAARETEESTVRASAGAPAFERGNATKTSEPRGAAAQARGTHGPGGTEGVKPPAETEERAHDPIGARRADALARIAECFLSDQRKAFPSASDRYQVVVHIDQSLLAGTHEPDDPFSLCELEHGPRLALETARRLACDARLLGIVESDHGTPLDVGRKTRAIPLPLERALRSRDRGCRFPGCERHRHTQAHHIEHWADGGETKLENLVTLCWYHHTLLHEGQFGVTLEREGQFIFTRPDGRPLIGPQGATPRFRGSAPNAALAARGSGSTSENELAQDRGTVPDTVLAAHDREIAELIASHEALGLEIDASTARTRWIGERVDYSIAMSRMYFDKHGRV